MEKLMVSVRALTGSPYYLFTFEILDGKMFPQGILLSSLFFFYNHSLIKAASEISIQHLSVFSLNKQIIRVKLFSPKSP